MLTKGEVDRIRKLIAKKKTDREIARLCRVAKATVNAIRNGHESTRQRTSIKITKAAEDKFIATLHLSVSESASVTGYSSDYVRLFRKRYRERQRMKVRSQLKLKGPRQPSPGSQKKRYSFALGDPVIRSCDSDRESAELGHIIEADANGVSYKVHWADGREDWRFEQSLAYHPTADEIAERAAAIAAQWPADHPNRRQQFLPVEPHEWHVYDSGVDRVL